MNGLPYFKFMVMEWLGGDIQMCSHTTKGIFSDMIAQLWNKGGYLPADEDYLATLLKTRKPSLSKALAELKRCYILLEDPNKGYYVKFILEQLRELRASHKARVDAGRKGGQAKQLGERSKARALLKQSSSNQNQKKNQKKKGEAPPSILDLKDQAEAAEMVADTLEQKFALGHESYRAQYPEQWAECKAHKERAFEIRKQIAARSKA